MYPQYHRRQACLPDPSMVLHTHKGSGQKPAAFSHFFSSKFPAHQNTATMPLTSSPGFNRG